MKKILTLLIVSIVLSACQTGRIPCPRVKTAKLSRSHPGRSWVESPLAKANDKAEDSSNKESKTVKITQSRFVSNISEEEWDCPQPGSKKYLPRHVKQNIRRNMKKMNDAQETTAAALRSDSTRIE